MENMYFWVRELAEKSKLNLRYLKQLDIKQTVEYILHVILEDKDTHKKYMCALSFSDLQKFRMSASVQLIYKMEQTFNKFFCFNAPVWVGKIKSLDADVVLYEYFENAKRIDINDNRPVEVLNQLYEECEEKLVTDSLIEEIVQNILRYNYPAISHAKVRETKELKEYINILRQMKTVRLINTHLDYSPSNILIDEEKMYLIDYEQGGLELPIGYDKLHYLKYQNKLVIEQIPYYELNKALYDVFHIPIESWTDKDYEPKIDISKNQLDVTITVYQERNKLQIAAKELGKDVIAINFDNIFILPYTYRKTIFLLMKEYKYILVVKALWDIGKLDKQEHQSAFYGVFSNINLYSGNLIVRKWDQYKKKQIWHKWLENNKDET